MKKNFLFGLILLLVASSCKKESEVQPELESITLDSSEINLKPDESHQLTASLNPSDAINSLLKWTSSDSTIASVSQKGLVFGKNIGQATIAVKNEDETITAICTVTVSPIEVEGLTLNKTETEVNIGGTEQLAATISPAKATFKDLKWTSSNTGIVDVSQTGLVTAVGIGDATITVSTPDGKVSATCKISVRPIPITSITLNKSTVTLIEGEELTLVAVIAPSNATNKKIVWTSSNSQVVTVSQAGVVTAKGKGTATIFAKSEDGEVQSHCQITVKESLVPITSITLNKSTVTLIEGEELTLVAVIAPSNATNKKIVWTSSDSQVVTVSEAGVVTTKGTGTATIFAKSEDGEVQSHCQIIVKGPLVPITSITLNKSTVTLIEGEELTLVAVIAPSNATNKKIVWTSSNSQVVTVSQAGVVTAKGKGTATIFAKSEDGEVQSHCQITVKEPLVPITSITLNKSTVTLIEGELLTLVAVIAPSNATNKKIVWTSSNSQVVTVSQAGVVTATGKGTATIFAKSEDGEVQSGCQITVKEVVVFSRDLFERLRREVLNEALAYNEKRGYELGATLKAGEVNYSIQVNHDKGETRATTRTGGTASFSTLQIPEGNVQKISSNFTYTRIPNSSINGGTWLTIDFFRTTWKVTYTFGYSKTFSYSDNVTVDQMKLLIEENIKNQVKYIQENSGK